MANLGPCCGILTILLLHTSTCQTTPQQSPSTHQNKHFRCGLSWRSAQNIYFLYLIVSYCILLYVLTCLEENAEGIEENRCFPLLLGLHNALSRLVVGNPDLSHSSVRNICHVHKFSCSRNFRLARHVSLSLTSSCAFALLILARSSLLLHLTYLRLGHLFHQWHKFHLRHLIKNMTGHTCKYFASHGLKNEVWTMQFLGAWSGNIWDTCCSFNDDSVSNVQVCCTSSILSCTRVCGTSTIFSVTSLAVTSQKEDL